MIVIHKSIEMVEGIWYFLNINYKDFYSHFVMYTKIFNSTINNFEIFWRQIGFVTGKLNFEISSIQKTSSIGERFNKPLVSLKIEIIILKREELENIYRICNINSSEPSLYKFLFIVKRNSKIYGLYFPFLEIVSLNSIDEFSKGYIILQMSFRSLYPENDMFSHFEGYYPVGGKFRNSTDPEFIAAYFNYEVVNGKE
ncbi:MAG: hypothetical protein ABDH21_06710 [bacterium]